MVRRGVSLLLVWVAPWLGAASKVLIDEPQVKVVLAGNSPGEKSQPHKHGVNRVMVHLDAGKMRLAYEDGAVKDLAFDAGEVRWDPAGGVHTSENTGQAPFHIVEVEVKSGAGPAPEGPLDVLKAAPEHHKLVFENDQVRVLRMLVAPGQKTALHEHVLPRVTVYLTGVQARVTLANGRSSLMRAVKGKVSKGGAAKHAERNLGKAAMEVIFVEMKGR